MAATSYDTPLAHSTFPEMMNVRLLMKQSTDRPSVRSGALLAREVESRARASVSNDPSRCTRHRQRQGQALTFAVTTLTRVLHVHVGFGDSRDLIARSSELQEVNALSLNVFSRASAYNSCGVFDSSVATASCKSVFSDFRVDTFVASSAFFDLNSLLVVMSSAF